MPQVKRCTTEPLQGRNLVRRKLDARASPSPPDRHISRSLARPPHCDVRDRAAPGVLMPDQHTCLDKSEFDKVPGEASSASWCAALAENGELITHHVCSARSVHGRIFQIL